MTRSNFGWSSGRFKRRRSVLENNHGVSVRFEGTVEKNFISVKTKNNKWICLVVDNEANFLYDTEIRNTKLECEEELIREGYYTPKSKAS